MSKEIPLSRNMVAIVDDIVYDSFSKYNWHFMNTGYAKRTDWNNGKQKEYVMHREVYKYYHGEIPEGLFIDHINGNRLDNRIENLRLVTPRENAFNRSVQSNNNSSKYKGVHLTSHSNSYYAYITVDGKRKSIGCFSSEIAAANAYNHYAKIYHGEFAKLNEVPHMEEEEWEKYRTKKSRTNKYKGIYFRKDNKKWRITIHDLKGKRINLGQAETLEEALKIRNDYLLNNNELLDKYNLDS